LGDLRPQVRPKPPPRERALTLAEFVSTWDDYADSDEDEIDDPEQAATVDVVMLSAPILLTKETLAVCGSKANWVRWKAMAESVATILLVSVGEIPDASRVLNYERCRNEERRQLLIVRRFRGKKTSLADMVACAAKMAAEGSIPGPQGASCRKTEFMRRCVKALKSLDPHAETDMKKLSILDRYAVLVALGEKKKTLSRMHD
jgi:hypothetical protein